jgi:hypothetical protein
MRRLALAGLVFLLAGCGGNSPSTAPDEFGVSGTYSGAAQDQPGGAGAVTADLTNSYGSVTGTWKATGGGFEDASYNVWGSTFENGDVAFTVCPSCFFTPNGGGGGGCSYKMQGKSQPGKIVATYTTFGQCTTPHSGSVTLTKQ